MVTRYVHYDTDSLRSSIDVMDKVDEKIITISSQSQKERGHKPFYDL